MKATTTLTEGARARIPVKIKITMNENIPLYQKLAPKIRELKALNLTNNEIAVRLKISYKTIRKGLTQATD